MTQKEKRRFYRKEEGKFKVKFFVDNELVEGETTDVSMGGAFVVSTRIPLTNRVITVKLFPGLSNQAVTLEARVAHATEAGFGLEWMQAIVPINPQPLRVFLNDVLGITKGFARKMEDASGVQRFVYKFSYEFLEKLVRETSRGDAPPPRPGAIPTTFTTSKGKVQAYMVGGYENGLVILTGSDTQPPRNFERMDIVILPDDKKDRLELKGLVSRVKKVDDGSKVYVRLTLENPQRSLERFRELADDLRD
jgi:hypothetical protein